MKTKLITALRTAAKAIEDGTIAFAWTKACRCNCGVLACALTGKSPVQLNAALPQGTGTWEDFVGTHCPITGMPEHEILRSMFAAGLTQRDMIDLEYLENQTVLKRAGFIQSKKRLLRRTKVEDVSDYSAAADVVAYMRAWADLLTEEGAMDVAAPAMQQAQVS